MKILIIDNNTRHLKALLACLKDHSIEVRKYNPGLNFDTSGKDLVILSGGGGEGKEANDHTHSGELWYQDETKFILDCRKPLIGICMGFELIAQAFGAEIKKLPKLVEGFKQIQPIGQVFESHRWCVTEVPTSHFSVLAESDDGIEMIQHKKRAIVACQFHPEIPGSHITLENLVAQLN